MIIKEEYLIPMKIFSACATFCVLLVNGAINTSVATPSVSPGPNSVVSLNNVPYSEVLKVPYDNADKKIMYGQNQDQYYQFWPAVSDSAFTSTNTAILYVHGGCWLRQFDIKHSYAMTSVLATQGFDVYSIEYRRTGNGGEWPVALRDLEKGLQKLKTQSPEIEKLFIVGHSAGGHLASLLSEYAVPLFDAVHFVGLAPIMDVIAYGNGEDSCQKASIPFFNGSPKDVPNAYAEANPLTRSLSQLSSAVSFAGGEDKIVPARLAQHPNAEYTLVQKAGHFDWIHPESDAFKELLTYLKEQSKDE